MRKKVIIGVFLSILSIVTFAQKENDCFNIINFFPLINSDSTSSKFIFTMDQKFYDYSIDCKVPEFKVTSINGDTIELSKLKGKIVVINFWFIECGGCIEEIPDINKLVKEYKNKSIVFISMTRNSKESLNKFILKDTLNSIIIPDCEKIADKYCVLAWPSTFILNRKGRLVKAFVGNGVINENDKVDFYERIKKIINELL